MKRRRTLRTIALTAALGLGVWTLAFTFTSASFSDGDILSAEALNTLLNDNFAAVEGELERLDDTKLSVSSSGHVSRVVSFRTNTSGAAVSIKNSGSGHLLQAIGSGLYGTAITNNGDILLGPMSAEGSENIRISAEEGTITNNVGSGLPLAFGSVSGSDGRVFSGTSNFSVQRLGSGSTAYYEIAIDGESYHVENYTTIVTPSNAGGFIPRTSSSGGALRVRFDDSSATNVETNFHFVTFKAPPRD